MMAGVAATSRRIAAGLVHLLTASGAVAGMMALAEVAGGRIEAALPWMLAALVLDSVDGPLARRLRVREELPEIDGTLLDNVVDYLNYVVVPAFLIHRAELLPPGLGVAGAAGICFVSALQFAQVEAKTADGYFRGFPSYWNVVAFYLLLLGLPPAANLALVAVLGCLVFVPVYWVYPNRTPTLRVPTLLLSAAWIVSLVVLLAQYPAADRRLALASLLFVVYYAALSLALTARRRRA